MDPLRDDGVEALAGLRILVAEDMRIIATGMVRFLHDMGCEVEGPYEDVGPALAAARSRPLDGALLDINLSERVVYPVASELAARGIPFVFVTGYAPQHVAPAWRSRPILEKPYFSEDLAAMMRSVFCARRCDGAEVVVRGRDERHGVAGQADGGAQGQR